MNELIQGTEEWKELRRNKIGASDAPVIMLQSPFKTPLQLWEEKIGLRNDSKDSPWIRRGLDLEEKARTSFEKKMNISMKPQVIIHPMYEWMMASLDGMDTEKKSIVEIKCPGKEDHSLARDGKIPEKYYAQLQHQLEVTGLDMVFYYSFDGDDGVVVEVPRNSKYIRDLIQEEKKFWDCMVDFLPPEMTKRDYTQKEDDKWRIAAHEWLGLQKKLHELEMREKELRDILISQSENTSCIGHGIRTIKTVRKGNIDYGAIPELKGKSLEKYRKRPVEFWRITKE